MKRLRSYGEDLDDADERSVFKDWGRRDQDLDRPSSHRRLYSKADSGRKGSYDRSIDDDRELGRLPRKRFEHESDGYDRRKGFDRYDRMNMVASPRNIYCGPEKMHPEKIHRSESFSRREFPKGFRSWREPPRRKEIVSSWRRCGKDADEDPKRANRVGSEDRGSSRSSAGSRDVGKSPPWSKDSGGEQSKSVELEKAEEANGESNRSSEMEEGELEPDPEPKPEQGRQEMEPQSQTGSGMNLEVKLVDREKLKIDENQEAGMLKTITISSRVEEVNEEQVNKVIESGEIKEHAEANGSREKEENANEECNGLSSTDYEPESGGKEEANGEMNTENAMDIVVEQEQEKSRDLEIKAPSLPDSLKEATEANDMFEVLGTKEGDAHLPNSNKEATEENDTIKEWDICSSISNKEAKNGGTFLPDSNKEAKEGEDMPEELGIKAGGTGLFNSGKEATEGTDKPEVPLRLLADELNDNGKDKGKGLAVSLSDEGNSTEAGGWMTRDLLVGQDDAIAGPSSGGFQMFFHSDVTRPENRSHSSTSQYRDDKLRMEPLELSLGLPGVSVDPAPSNPIQAPNSPNHAPNSPSRGRSAHSLPNTFRTSSDGFTASISFSGSQTFFHNPSCSLTQNSFENYEQSVGSHPIFQAVDQVSQGIWQGQSSNEPKCKEISLYQRMLQNGKGALHASQATQGNLNSQTVQGQHLKVAEGRNGIPNGVDQQLILSRQLSGQLRHDLVRSPTHSVGSQETRSEHTKDRKQWTRERNDVLLMMAQREMGQLVPSGADVLEKMIVNIVSEPVQMMSRKIQEMPDQSVTYLKDIVYGMIRSEDKHGQLRALQGALQRRPDLTLEALKNCHRAQLEILVAIKTGLRDFLQRSNNVQSSDLAEIFLNLKCRNLNCQSVLPVDECECKICIQKNGFCSACMCLVCSKFDTAYNTCSWVGCDVCLHWCHTDCGLRDSHIRNGRSVLEAQGTTEMQFHCVACGHPSEMFGFVKEVFKTCAKDWQAETFSKELEYVKRIFHASEDARGKQLHDMAVQMLVKLENKSNITDVYNGIMVFLSESNSKPSNSLGILSKELSPKNPGEGSNGIAGPSQESKYLRPTSTEKGPATENSGSILPRIDWDQMGSRTAVPDLQAKVEKRPVMDELESIVRIKLAEAEMFQARADDARREAEGLKRIANAKNEKIDQDYAVKIGKLRLAEAEERRKLNLKELQDLEKAHCDYFNMKLRMEAYIKDMLLKMETTKRNLTT